MKRWILLAGCLAAGVAGADAPGAAVRHPAIDEMSWSFDRNAAREGDVAVVAFAKRHDARIFVGEFSAIAWAEGADRYLRDCIELFDEQGWDWCYHAFNEWRGWNVEQTFDCVHVDRANRALHFTRIGGGGDRTFHLDARTVCVGETLRFSPAAAATWACYDADRLRTDPAPDNKWQKLRTYFDDVALISPDGVLTAKKPGESVVLAILPDGSKEFFPVTVLP